MRLAGDIPQVVVEPARAGIGPLCNVLQRFAPCGLRLQFADLGKSFLEPETIVEREIQRIQTRPAVHADRLV